MNPQKKLQSILNIISVHLTEQVDSTLLKHLEYRCALVADAVYRAEELPHYGLHLATEQQKSEILGKPESELTDLSDSMREQLYYDERSKRFILAFAGTDPLNVIDWIQNVSQFVGLPTEYYQNAVTLVRAIKLKDRDKVILTGHSLGGGVAAVAAIAGKMNAFVFNPPSIHRNTLAEFDPGNVALAETNVHRFVVTGEILDIINLTLGAAQNHVGKKTQLCGSFSIPVSSIFGLTALFKRFIPGVGITLGILAPLAEKSLKLHLMDEVLYGLINYLASK
ncbi:MAG: DUF2974 domain-containing protein [Planctomycetaceae bacterium]|jgi:hypothetical protein|nr:DUF2974 domain-containing protein [Planctomycetaceae bacterium]